MIVFFVAWLICGCSTDTMLDEPVSGVIALIAKIVAVACAWAMGYPHLGQAAAKLDTSLPQSGHLISGIFSSLYC